MTHGAFEHLYRSLFKKPNDLIAMISGYLDDSGSSPSNEVAVVAGYLGYVDQWEQFVVEWKKLLDEFGISKLHRAELESFKGEYSDWNPDRRSEFVAKAQQIIKNRTCMAVGEAVVKADYEAIIPHNFRRVFGTYAWCAMQCLSHGAQWAKRIKYNDPIRWVFEASTKGSRDICVMLDSLYRYGLPEDIKTATEKIIDKPYEGFGNISGWSFQGKEVVPLQAADVLAYELYKSVRNTIIEKGKRRERISAVDLFNQRPKYLHHWDKKIYRLGCKRLTPRKL